MLLIFSSSAHTALHLQTPPLSLRLPVAAEPMHLPRRFTAARMAIAAEPMQPTFSALGTPANYTSTLAAKRPEEYSVIKWQAPYCRSCKKPSKLLERHASELPETTQFYSMDLLMDRKAAGRRMAQFFRQRQVTVIAFFEVYRGDELIEAGPDEELASLPCIITPTSVSCTEGQYSALLSLMHHPRVEDPEAGEIRQ